MLSGALLCIGFPVDDKWYRCSEIDISPGRRSVLVRGQPRHVRAKSFDLLLYLIENRHRLVPKDELLDRVWNDAEVNDNSPAQCVIELRKALGDDARSSSDWLLSRKCRSLNCSETG